MGLGVFLRSKPEINLFLHLFCNTIETQSERKVKQIRLDNGKEFQSNHMLDYYKEKRIVLQTSCPC